ncbi:MAG: hypothetical protein U5L06_06420 [Rhodovibrio sp.]|nr:hypothetical protein [Rhodovibrio sp.]
MNSDKKQEQKRPSQAQGHTEPDIEPDDSESESTDATPKQRRSVKRGLRELSEEELNQSGVQILLIEDNETLQYEKRELELYRTYYYDTKEKLAVAQTKQNIHIASELIYVGTVAVGSALLSAAISGDESDYIGILGALLILIGVFARVIRK